MLQQSLLDMHIFDIDALNAKSVKNLTIEKCNAFWGTSTISVEKTVFGTNSIDKALSGSVTPIKVLLLREKATCYEAKFFYSIKEYILRFLLGDKP